MALDDFGGWPGLLARLCDGEDLSADEAEAVLTEILGGEAEPAQIAGFLVGPVSYTHLTLPTILLV